ncbi:MAG: endonuclease NucS domain-containing protein [Thermoguttaceae bacterium]
MDAMQPGDLMFIYESKTGKTIVKKTAGGKLLHEPRRKGAEGIVALVEITSAPAEDVGKPPDTYSDGSQIWWRYKADGRVINSVGFVSRKALANLLGYSENYAFRGFGDQNSGLKKLSSTEYDAIHTAFLASQSDVKLALKKKRATGGMGGGEGPVHKSLKEYIAAHPEEALKEPGLHMLDIEYPFATGDRIDVLLEDKNGRLVTVEVEVDCDDTEIAGPLQCMKYRAMLASLLDRRVSEVRTVLAARSIAGKVKKQCGDYDVEVVEIPAWSST